MKEDRTYGAYSALACLLDGLEPEESGLEVMRVALLRNYTIEPLLPVLKGEMALIGYHPLLQVSHFDTIASDVLDPGSSFYSFEPDMVLLMQWLDGVAPELVHRFTRLTPVEVDHEISRVVSHTGQFLNAIRERISAPVVFNNFPLPPFVTLGILDAQSADYQVQSLLRLNGEMLRLCEETADAHILDMMSLFARIGSDSALDHRYLHMARAPVGRAALVPLGELYGRFVRALRARTRKCLVLDCDNTLWGGIIGEDGLAEIKIGPTYPGSCYRAFQQEVLNLHDRGVILALCSKNNEEDVLSVLRGHPQMLLREEHFSSLQINWDDKATNLMRTAHHLNIALDSLVLVDDSQFECDLVRDRLPEVEVVQLPVDPSAFSTTLASKGHFDLLTFSAEDRQRTAMYRAQLQRKELEVSSGSLADYLTKLGMVAEVGLADPLTVPRIAQLSQKTNQFNLVTRRYSEGEITALGNSPNMDVIYLHLKDCISDLGLVGVAISRYTSKEAEIDTFLLSCRAIGRDVEAALLAAVTERARARGCESVIGRYIPTKRNGLVAEFYRKHGFEPDPGEGPEWWRRTLGEALSAPDWIVLKRRWEEDEDGL